MEAAVGDEAVAVPGDLRDDGAAGVGEEGGDRRARDRAEVGQCDVGTAVWLAPDGACGVGKWGAGGEGAAG